MVSPFTLSAGSDKAPGSWHGAYLPIYARLFEPLRDSTGSILEIGVYEGASLLMYADYFKNAGSVIGMDLNPCPDAVTRRGGISFIQADAYHEPLKANPDFSLIVDDGSHQLKDQCFFCSHYPNLLSEQGLAIVEDVQRIEDFAALAASVPKDFFSFGIDLRMHDDRYDNLLFVVHRR